MVERHVVPYLRSVPPGLDGRTLSLIEAAAEIAHYLAGDDDVLILADWPDDIGYFCHLLVTKAGDMAPVGNLRFEFVELSLFRVTVKETSAAPRCES